MSSTIDSAVIPTGTWTLDATHSSVGFTVVYMGVAPFSGAFRSFEASLDESGLRGKAQASSIDVDSEQLAQHLASPDFFDAATYPEVSFDATSIERDGNRVKLDGTLQIKGKRAPITLTGTIADPVADPWGNSKLALSLEGSVDKNAVGLTWNAPLPEGGSMLADERRPERDARVRPAGKRGVGDDPRHRRQPARRLAQRAAPPPRRGGAAGGRRARRVRRARRDPGLRRGSPGSRPGRRRRAEVGSRRGGRDPRRDPRVQRVDSRAHSRTRSTGSPARSPRHRCAASRSP